MEVELSYKCVQKHLLRLRLGGYYQIDPLSPTLHKRLHDIYMRITLVWIIIYTVQQAIKLYEVRYDMDKVMGTLFLFLTHTDSIYKQLVIWIKADKIEELLDIMRGPLFNQGEDDHKTYLLQVANTSTFLLNTDNCLALSTCFLWTLLPFVLHLQGKSVEFAIWLPFDVNVDPAFYFILIYVWFTTSWLAFCNTTIDVMVSFLFGQCKTQLSIVSNDLLNLTKRSREEHVVTGVSCTDIISRRFRKILQHHLQIVYFTLYLAYRVGGGNLVLRHFNPQLPLIFFEKLRVEWHNSMPRFAMLPDFVQKVEDIFSTAIAYQFLISGWIICTSVYRMVDMNPASVQFLSMVLYISCMLIQIFMYCYYGNEVTIESDNLTESAYSMNWLDINLHLQRHVILFMERIKKPIRPLAGRIIPLSNDTFVSIVKNSYTFYALLKNTNE